VHLLDWPVKRDTEVIDSAKHWPNDQILAEVYAKLSRDCKGAVTARPL
jgi:hypothetical protein